MESIPFITGKPSSTPLPLEDYLPKLSSSILTTWLERVDPSHNLILDPFGSSPQALLYAARNHYRIVVSINNPITRFLVTYAAQAPTQENLQSALVKLSSAYKGEERLEPHILSLYETECPRCGRLISAQAFIWKAKGSAPDKKICHCQHCQNRGEYPTSEHDIHKAQEYSDNSLYHARALTRIAPPDDPIRRHADNALQLYTPRAVYALFTLINKMSGLSLTRQEKNHIRALLLHAFYRTNNLWPYPGREKALLDRKSPSTYRENNVWHALEEAVQVWHQEKETVQVTRWPDLPPAEGGISVYPGRFRDLAEELNETFGAAMMVVPQPNPNFWSLSALWAGWLWGQEKSAPLRNILSLQKPDWTWHTRALQNTFTGMVPFLSHHTPCFGILPRAQTQFLVSAVTASNASGFNIQGAAVDPQHQQVQIVWVRREDTPHSPSPERPKAVLRNAGYSHLIERGEPSYTLLLHTAGIKALDEEGAFPGQEDQEVSDTYQALMEEIQETFAYRQGFLHYPDSDTWWHQELTPDIIPLADEVERDLVNHLISAKQPMSEVDILNRIYSSYPGLQTPNSQLIRLCLESYGEKVNPEGDAWVLKEKERPTARRQDIQDMDGLVYELGQRLGYQVARKPPRGNVSVCTWNADGEQEYTFLISASAVLGKLILTRPEPPPNPWIVLPGSRAHVVVYKLSHNQPLAELVEESWGFLKYRHLRRLADEDSLTRENIEERFRLDPLKYDAHQLPLI